MKTKLHDEMNPEHSEASDVLLELVARAIEVGADNMEIEYKNGREEVFAVGSGIGVGIASLDSSNEETRLLREELYAIGKKKPVVLISGCHTPCGWRFMTASARMRFASR